MEGYIAYVRVSATRGREEGGEGAQEQREDIAAWETSRPDVEVIEFIEDMDQTGGKLDRPGLKRALRRLEDGEADGIVVAKANRLSRTRPEEALRLMDRIDRAGGKLVAINIGIDPTTPAGEAMWTTMLAFARMEHRTLSEGLERSKARRREEGVHLAPAPIGYTRPSKNSRLVPDDRAPRVRECFLLRADGKSWMDIVRFLDGHGIKVGKSSVGYMLRSRTYLGEIQGGDIGTVCHPAIVTVEEWDAAQGVGRASAKDGTVASEGILSGLITCGGCGHKLSVGRSGGRQPGGKRAARYGCRRHFASGTCPARASANVANVDAWMEAAISRAITDGTLETTLEAAERYSSARAAVQGAEAALEHFIQEGVRLTASLGVEGYAKVADEHRAILDEAKKRLRDTPRPEDAILPDSNWGSGDWPVPERRRLVKQLVAEVVLVQGRGPAHERVSIRWAGHDAFDSTVWERGARERELAAKLLAG